MSETPWTPGPWYVDADYPCNVSTADHRTIAETCDSWFNLEISRANARLIAAAPELVAALEHFMAFAKQVVRQPCAADCDCMMAKADALLARIRGEASDE